MFAGYRDDAARVVAAADVLALPSWTEGLPLVVLEAMALRTPGRRDGGRRHARSSSPTARPGLLVPPRDVDALTAALKRVLDDEGLRQRLGEAGKRRVASGSRRRR